MARVNASIRFDAGDAPQINDDAGFDFFIVYADARVASFMVIDDDRWSEAEAFAHRILDGIAQRRARKAATSMAVEATTGRAETLLVGEEC